MLIRKVLNWLYLLLYTKKEVCLRKSINISSLTKVQLIIEDPKAIKPNEITTKLYNYLVIYIYQQIHQKTSSGTKQMVTTREIFLHQIKDLKVNLPLPPRTCEKFQQVNHVPSNYIHCIFTVYMQIQGSISTRSSISILYQLQKLQINLPLYKMQKCT